MLRRVVGCVLLFWFTFAAVDPYGWHLRCPMDNPLAAALMGEQAVHTSGAMAGMDMGYCHGAPRPGSHHPASHQCCCMGACCCSAVLNVDGGRLVALPVVPIITRRVTYVMTNERPYAARSDVVLPPPLGPPALRV